MKVPIKVIRYFELQINEEITYKTVIPGIVQSGLVKEIGTYMVRVVDPSYTLRFDDIIAINGVKINE